MSRRLQSTALPYSKVADVAGDAFHLESYALLVDVDPEVLRGQHAIRRWEYAMALRTVAAWQLSANLSTMVANPLAAPGARTVEMPALRCCDVGGAGSGFWRLLRPLASQIDLLDPAAPSATLTEEAGHVVQVLPVTVEAHAAVAPHDQYDILTAISVIEHVKEPRAFFRACRMLLKPGGLLFLTTDYWDAEGPDVAHFHWMRERIYNFGGMRRMSTTLRELGFSAFGEADWAYHGPQLYNYSVVSLAMVRRPV